MNYRNSGGCLLKKSEAGMVTERFADFSIERLENCLKYSMVKYLQLTRNMILCSTRDNALGNCIN